MDIAISGYYQPQENLTYALRSIYPTKTSVSLGKGLPRSICSVIESEVQFPVGNPHYPQPKN